MKKSSTIEGEVLEAWDRYLAIRHAAEKGKADWSEIADLFTEDAQFYDSSWGRHRGRKNLRQFLKDSMAGIEGWTFPVQWQMVEGNRLLVRWVNRLPGQRPDGSHYDVPAFTTLLYAGDGLFSWEEDLYDTGHLHEVIAESGWQPGAGFQLPPRTLQR